MTSTFHITWASEGRVAFDNNREIEVAVGALDKVLGPRLLTFAVADDHIHALIETDDPGNSGRWLRASLATLRPFEPGHVRPVRSQGHLESVVEYHLFEQHQKHDLLEPPGQYTGSSLLDHLGGRVLRNFDPGRMERRAPRFSRAALLRQLGHPRLAPMSHRELADLSASRLYRLARRTVFALPYAKGKARALACQAHAGSRAIRTATGLSARGVRAAVARVVPEELSQALRRHAAIDRAVRSG